MLTSRQFFSFDVIAYLSTFAADVLAIYESLADGLQHTESLSTVSQHHSCMIGFVASESSADPLRSVKQQKGCQDS